MGADRAGRPGRSRTTSSRASFCSDRKGRRRQQRRYGDDFLSVLDTREAKGQALVRRKGPGYAACPRCIVLCHQRWIQDRQTSSGLSRPRGLILGGGIRSFSPCGAPSPWETPAFRARRGRRKPGFRYARRPVPCASEAAVDTADPCRSDSELRPENAESRWRPLMLARSGCV